jgi:hypothetical protein
MLRIAMRVAFASTLKLVLAYHAEASLVNSR